MTADLGALVCVCVRACKYVCVCVCVFESASACVCMSEVLCLKRMNHLLCHRDAGRIGRVMLEGDKRKDSRDFLVF